MKPVVIAVVLCVLTVGAVAAGQLGVYTDASATSCDLTTSGAGLFQAYVVYTGDPGVSTLEFSAPRPACWSSAVFIQDLYSAVYVISPGNSQDGIILSHFGCEARPMVVMTIEYLGIGIPPSTCCPYPVLPHGGTGLLRGLACGASVVPVNGHTSVFNGDQSCPCTVPGPVPIEQSTWGALKALYD